MSRTPPMAIDLVEALEQEAESSEDDAGVEKVMNLCAADEMLAQSVAVLNIEIMKIVKHLGADTGQYRRERNQQIGKLVSEIYSGPRVTSALKLLPGLGLAPGFAFDLTTVDDEGNNWDFSIPAMRDKAERCWTSRSSTA